MNPATALARVLVDELVRCGLTEAVVAPGSRSAPLALALAERAGRREPGGLRLHVRIDERSAAYLAVGLAGASGRPAAVVCTSGSAAANLHPAVVEAGHARVPLLVITADRPPELRHTGANQTIDQLKLYSDTVRWFCEIGTPEPRPGMVAYWRSTACRAWAFATGDATGNASGDDAGPVHLNAAFREPLLPDGDADWPDSLEGRPSGAPWTAPDPPRGTPPPATVTARRGVLVAGDGHYDPLPYVAAAQAAGWPVLAEPSSNARRGTHAVSTYHHLLQVPGFAAAHQPDVVVTVGKPGLSRPLLTMIADAPEQVVVDTGPRWADPARSASRRLASGTPLALAPSDDDWIGSWMRADAAARRALDRLLDTDDDPSEPRLARDLAAAVPPGALLLAGSSMPVRDLDQTMRPRDGLRILANRGASGIDGTVSTAFGAALAHDGPAFALLGDLALLHDTNGLLLGPDEARPDLLLVAVNNDGGGIFSLLPQAGHRESFERLFGTPHGADLAHLAAAYRMPYTRLTRMRDLPDLVAGSGPRLLEVRTDRADNARLHRRITEAVAAAVCGAGHVLSRPRHASRYRCR